MKQQALIKRVSVSYMGHRFGEVAEVVPVHQRNTLCSESKTRLLASEIYLRTYFSETLLRDVHQWSGKVHVLSDLIHAVRPGILPSACFSWHGRWLSVTERSTQVIYPEDDVSSCQPL